MEENYEVNDTVDPTQLKKAIKRAFEKYLVEANAPSMFEE